MRFLFLPASAGLVVGALALGVHIPSLTGAAGLYPLVTEERLVQPEDESWLLYRRTYDGHGYSPLNRINTRNVSDLSLAWFFRTGVHDGQPQSAPVVNGDWMFVTTAEQVIALDAVTGRERWRHHRALPDDLKRPHSVNRGVALFDDLVFVGTLDAHVVALRATTGEVVWDVEAADYRLTYYITLAPLVADGKVMVGSSGAEHGIRGFVAAFDAATGAEVWRTHTIPAPGEPGSETWPGDAWRTGGGSVWVTGHYDPALNVAYWGVGNPGPWTGDVRPGDNLYTNSTIALDVETGALLDHFQYHHNGSWDWDEASAPLLVDLQRGRSLFPALVHPGRNGYLWLLDRSSGRMEFESAQPFVYQNVFLRVDPVTGRPEYHENRVPAVGREVEYCPRGARNWQPESWSPQTRLLYVPASENVCSTMVGYPVVYRPGEAFVGAENKDERRFEGAYAGRVQAWALDVRSHRPAWVREYRNPVGSVMATGGGLVFFDNARRLQALDALNGATLWTGGQIRNYRPTSPASTYMVRGEQFVAVQYQVRPEDVDDGNLVAAFSLDCQC